MKFTIERLKELLSIDYDNAITSHSVEVVAFYAYIFNEPDACLSCPSKLKNYWTKLQESGLKILKNKIMKKRNSKFTIKEGVPFLQMDFGSSVLFNNNSITDELAIEYLRINPNERISNFSTYPENWEEMIEKEEAEENTNVEMFGKEIDLNVAINLFEQSGIKTGAKTDKGLLNAYKNATEEQKESLKNLVESLGKE